MTKTLPMTGLVLLAACAGSNAAPAAAPPGASLEPSGDPPAQAQPVETAAPSAETAKPADAPLAAPAACDAGDSTMCIPGAAFADRLCAASRPDMALALFAKGTPWTRMYLRGDVDGWNAEGGASARAKLVFDEEVVVLKRRAPASGAAVIVGASGGYQVLRWDGNCYSLDDGELTRNKPPRAKHPSIPWKYLNEKTKAALLSDPAIKAAYEKRSKECKGVTVGEVSLACENADTAFSNGIVAAVKSGLTIAP